MRKVTILIKKRKRSAQYAQIAWNTKLSIAVRVTVMYFYRTAPKTRVMLSTQPDYINANWVRVSRMSFHE